tara:strand:- start:465 stop:998 length:534 start_codon:yes stop_codon:yes gene_type:complete
MKISTIILFFISTILNAQDNVSNAELSKKLDLILGKLGGLEKRVTKLETDNVEVKEEVKEVAKSAEEAKTASQNLVIPQNEEEKKSFLNKLRIDLKSEEVKATGPWSEPETWNAMKKNLTQHKVRNLLGNPNDIKISLNPRIDRVFIYSGDVNADGLEETAEINFFRDRVISFSSPF